VTRVIEGSSDGTGLHIGVVAARWNQDITDRLVEGALARLTERGVTDITLVRVSGALELALAAKRLAHHGCDAVIAIGTVVKGETDHYDIVVNESARGLNLVSLETGTPITNAVLAVHDYTHAVERAGRGDSNKGAEAVDAAISTANALRELESN